MARPITVSFDNDRDVPNRNNACMLQCEYATYEAIANSYKDYWLPADDYNCRCELDDNLYREYEATCPHLDERKLLWSTAYNAKLDSIVEDIKHGCV